MLDRVDLGAPGGEDAAAQIAGVGARVLRADRNLR
jgi:hypothetical protein